MYKTQKGLAPDRFHDLYHSVAEVHSYNTRSANNGNLKIALTNLRAGDKAISVCGARVWNNFPDYIKQAQSLDVFKRVSNQVTAGTDAVTACNKYFHSF